MSALYQTESSRKIQILRAAAIIAVVAIHTCSFGAVGIIVRPFLNFAVALFLGLSGYLTSTELPLSKVKKRCLRVFIPYTLWSLIYTAIRGTWAAFPIHFLSGYSCGVFYFIVVYLQLTLLAPLAGKLLRSRYNVIGYLITPAAIGIQYMLELLGRPIPKPWNEVFFPVWFLFFYVGMAVRYRVDHDSSFYLNREQDRFHFSSYLKIAIPISILIQTVEGVLWKYAGSSRMPYTQIKFGSMLTSVLVILLALQWVTSRKPIPFSTKMQNLLVYIGDISFGIYFTHILFKDFLKAAVSYAGALMFPMSTILVLCMDIAAIYLIRQFFPKRFCRVLGLI